jgi:hypothetical protein
MVPTLAALPQKLFILSDRGTPQDSKSAGTFGFQPGQEYSIPLFKDFDSHRVLRVWTTEDSLKNWLATRVGADGQFQAHQVEKPFIVWLH